MTEPYTPAVVRTLRKNAGVVRPDEIARALGWSTGQLENVASKHGIDLRLYAMRESDSARRPTFAMRVLLPERRSEHFGVRLEPAAAKVLREKAAARLTNPSDLLALVIEGAIARGKVDDLASAARFYRASESNAEPQVE